MKFWLSVGMGPAGELLQSAQDAEALGYEGVVVPEHLVVKVGDRTPHPAGFPLRPELAFPDPMCVFSAMAAVTTRLRFMTYVYVVPLRNAFALAKQAATVAALSNNRVVLGTGVGWLREEFETVGEGWSTRGRRMDEMLDILRDFWDDGYAEYHGQFYDFPRSGMFPVPTERIPIWIGGHSGRAAERAARFDGYMPMDGLHERTRREFAEIETYRAEHGLDGPYEKVIVAPFDPDPDPIRRMATEDGITSVVVAPARVWGQREGALSYAEKRSLAERYMDEVIARV
jgi:probable F420-dependent oxidoreductase